MDKYVVYINYFLFFLTGAVFLLLVLLIFPSGGFAVDDVWHSKVADTEYHEACHALIDRDHEHFCKQT